MGRICGHLGEKRNVCRIQGWGLEGSRPLGRGRCSWVVVLKVNLKGMGLGGNGLIDLAKDRNKK